MLICFIWFTRLPCPVQVNHELSVPAVRLMLTAIAAYVAAVSSTLLLQDRVRPSTMFALRAVAAVGTIIMFFIVSQALTAAEAAMQRILVACLYPQLA
jgi:hypothetical protein